MISDAAKNAMKIFHPSQGLDEALDDWIDRGGLHRSAGSIELVRMRIKNLRE